jgi:hypothetical protein
MTTASKHHLHLLFLLWVVALYAYTQSIVNPLNMRAAIAKRNPTIVVKSLDGSKMSQSQVARR